MREKHPLGRRLLALTAAVCTLGSLAVAPVANAEQAAPAQPEAQQQAPQAGKADGAQQPENDAKPENADKPAGNGSDQKQPATDAGSADEAGQDVIPLDEEHFPDAKFREYVGRFDTVSLDGSKNPDGYLSQDERDKVTSIQLGGLDTSTWQQLGPVWDLKSVKGVEYFRNLASLNLETTGITELDVSGNTRLEKLYLGECVHLTKLNITRNTKLRELDVTEAGLSSLELPSGDDQLTFVDAISDETRPRLLAVRGATFKGDRINDVFVSGRAVVGDSLDLVTATGFTADELKGHILLVRDGWWLDDGKAGTKPFDGTVLRPEDGSSYMTYLFFPRLGDREKWMENPTGSKAPFMLVHLGFLDPAEHQEWRGLVEADPSEFTPASWSTAEEAWESLYDLGANYGYERSKQGFLDVLMNVQMSFDAAYDERMTNNHGETGGTSAYWESAVADYYEKWLKVCRDFYRVTPIAPTRGMESTADENVVTIPAAARATSYSVGDKEYQPGDQIRIPADGQIVVKAKVKDGWTLAENLDAKKQYWTFKWQSQTVAPKEPAQSGDVLTVSPVTGVEYFYTYDMDGKDLQSFDGQTSIRVGGRPVWVVAKPAKGYQFADNKTEVTYGPYSYTASNPPDNGNNNGGSGNGNNNGGNGGTTTPSVTLVDVERFYNTRNGEHFYTSNPVEQGVLRANKAWRDEGVAFRMASDKGTPVYRLYNPGGKHLFTTSEKERDALIKARWNYEGVAFHVPEGASVQVYRLYNPWNGDHLLTVSANERGVLVMHRWHDEGAAFNSSK